jgi:hypothetical protein
MSVMRETQGAFTDVESSLITNYQLPFKEID